MRFKDFLREARHRQDISVEKAAELIRTKCSNMDIEKPFWRGSKRAGEEAYIIAGEEGTRSSANSSNHYTVIMDEFLPAKGFPLRSASIILTNNAGEGYARSYSGGPSEARGIYAIFPYDDTPIGVCNSDDIWHLKTEVGNGRTMSLQRWNDWFNNAGIPDYSFEDLVQGIKDGIEEDEDMITAVFKDAKYVEQDLKQAFTPPTLEIKLAVSSGVPEDKERELWIGGKCVALRRDVWAKMLKEMGKEAPHPKD